MTTPQSLTLPECIGSWLMSYQLAWLRDRSPLRIMEKARQVGITTTDALDSVLLAAPQQALHDVWVTSRDELQSRFYVEDATRWARILSLVCADLGMLVLDEDKRVLARVLEFASGRRIYSLTSNPDALAGKRGHVKIDEFALHERQRELLVTAMPVRQWGGSISIFSTHRSVNTVFNTLINDIKRRNNTAGWSHHKVTIHDAVEAGIVERVNAKTGSNQTRAEFLSSIERSCVDNQAWLQEYNCIPATRTAQYYPSELLDAVEDPALTPIALPALLLYTPADPQAVLHIGLDVARTKHLCVFDIGITTGRTTRDLCRIVLQGKPFREIRSVLYSLLALPITKRCAIDATGLGMQLAEEAAEAFPAKVIQVTFTAITKNALAVRLRRDMESMGSDRTWSRWGQTVEKSLIYS